MAIALIVFLFPGFCVAATCANGEHLDPSPKENAGHLKNAYFGEQHLHTRHSVDSFTIGVLMDIEDTYQYAMGCEVDVPGPAAPSGNPIRRKGYRYDWVAITDHAEYLSYAVNYSDPNTPDDVDGGLVEILFEDASDAFVTGIKTDASYSDDIMKDRWQAQVAEIDRHNIPHVFTTLVAFEWTSTPDNANLHRNVFFNGGVGEVPERPFTTFDSLDPRQLWDYLEAHENSGSDRKNFSIAHNGNISNGLMYGDKMFKADVTNEELGEITDDDLEDMSQDYVRLRQKHEPLTEVLQTKGQSETHPTLSPQDEFADFEIYSLLIGAGETDKHSGGYIRQALAQGLEHEETLGFNPFKFGFVAGADTHSGFSDSEEDNFKGTHGVSDNTPELRLGLEGGGGASDDFESPIIYGTPGVTGVWAEENTRDGIFNAMEQKETFGTSGPFMHVRFFGGWNYRNAIFANGHETFLRKAYRKGVPMGSDLLDKPEDKDRPTFAVWAKRDPNSGGLDRIQIVKVWNENGISQEKVYDVVNFGNRKPGEDGRIEPLSSTVTLVENSVTRLESAGTVNDEVTTLSYDHEAGANELQAVWEDPYFDETQRAAYYVRVLEVKTPRWSTYDYVDLINGQSESDIDVSELEIPNPAVIQERAWSSPIWYTPAG